MLQKEAIQISKFLSLVLRHQPQKLGIALDAQGWTDVGILLDKMNCNGFEINRSLLEEIVATNNKKRFAFNADKTKIRASQGHSVAVNLGYQAVEPPELLYHGTSKKAVASILQNGLHKAHRQHLHLSADQETALKVGQRHGLPVVLGVEALKMYKQGHLFFLSQNGVWLTDFVPAVYLHVLPG